MLVEQIEDEESLKKSDPAEVDNLVRGFSKFDPFSKNHHKFSDHCLCRKCKWDPNFRSKRILESEFVEIHGVPDERPSPKPALKRNSSDESLLDKPFLADKKRKTLDETSSVDSEMTVTSFETGMSSICDDTVNLRLQPNFKNWTPLASREYSRSPSPSSSGDDLSPKSGRLPGRRITRRKFRDSPVRADSKMSPSRPRGTKVSQSKKRLEMEPILVELPKPVLKDENELKVDEEIIISPDKSSMGM